MEHTDETAVEEDIGEILRQRILRSWVEGKTTGQIAEETELPFEVVRRNLKQMQKELVKQRLASRDEENRF